MKIRNGFVSNSSSSSFLIYGVEITEEDVIENFNTLKKEAIKSLEKSKFSWRQEAAERLRKVPDTADSNEILEVIEESEGVSEFLENIDFKDLGVEHGPDYEDVYLGLCPTEIGDNETGRQFKDKIEAEIKKFFPNKNNFNFYKECWRDG